MFANLWLARYALQHVRARLREIADSEHKDFLLKDVDDALYRLNSLEDCLRGIVWDLCPQPVCEGRECTVF